MSTKLEKITKEKGEISVGKSFSNDSGRHVDPWWYNTYIAEDCGKNIVQLGNNSFDNKDGPEFSSVTGSCNNTYYEDDSWDDRTAQALGCGFARAYTANEKARKSGAVTNKVSTGLILFITASIGVQLLI
ncbi:uncharacterized protein RJT20DRAFT_2595 [Scheffersomyces xylosifermentans]|uniref:uncharacterized protein n=1 Tax=Scheffersomyces xylosifermentans TaxID=1304137 RepID=UPI00315E00C0